MKKSKKILSIALAAVILTANIPFSTGITSYAAYSTQQSKDIGYLEELLKGKNAPYDVMIKFSNEGTDTSLSLQEKADMAQKEALAIIEEAVKKQEVKEYESFYISNAIHIVTASKELLEKLAKLDSVEKITENSKVELINPVEKEKKRRTKRDTIYTPDERDIEWGVIDVHADKVWEEFGIDGSGITVGIIDTGVNYNIPAIKKSFLDYDSTSGTVINKVDDPSTKKWEGASYRDFVDNTAYPENSEVNDHGTHVAGTILGQQSNSVNRIGVAPGAKFISARAIGPEGGEVSDLLAAAQWMLEMKPDVINNSWGGPNDNDEWFKDIINAWNSAGIVPVFAAGNTSSKVPEPGSISNPGNYLDVISVAAVDHNKQVGRFSNKGPSAFDSGKSIIKPEISAPGVQVRSVDARGNYVSWNGTSMATPHVVGVIALIKEAAKKAGKEEEYDSLDEIRNLITSTAEPLSDNTYTQSPNMAYGYGLINAYDAVAKIMEDRTQGEISGVVLKDGADKRAPNLEINIQDEAYIGRKLKVEAKVDDDVSIREVKLSYYIGDDPQTAVEHELNLSKGVQNDGTYSYSIEADKLSKGTLHLSLSAKDYAQNTVTKQKDVEIKAGMTLPWESDLEQASSLNGFMLEGTWEVSGRKSSAEPELPRGLNGSANTTYVGTNAGRGVFEKRVNSYLYLPPVDLSTVTGNPSLSVDMYNGFTGLSYAKLQASFSGDENDWEDIYQVVLRPDITTRNWVHNTYSLAKYTGNAKPLQLRFYFYGHNTDEGAGWYLDNFSIKQQEDTPPAQVQALRASIGQKGVNLSFVANEETDMLSYSIERKEEGAATFAQIATIQQNLSDFTFINKNEDPTRPSSHYRVNYYDKGLAPGKKYIYRVRALDKSGNYSEYSKELNVDYSSYEETVFYDFEADNGGFTTGVLSGNINDWQWGKPMRPADGDYTKLLPRETWEGLEKNSTKVWGTNLNGKFRKNQDSYIQMPSVTVKDGDYLYFDSFNAQMSLDTALSLTVEIKEKNKNTWSLLVSRESIMDDNQIRVWQQIGADLSAYKGKSVDIRFHINVGRNIYIDSYNIGWYIDNVVVGDKEQKFKTDRLRVFTNEEASPSNASFLATDSDATTEYKEEANAEPGVNTASSIELDVGAGTGYYTAGSVPIPGGFPSNSYIPLRAKVKVLDTGKYTYASDIDGSFNINHAINKSDKKYRLEFSAYGYESKIVEVDLSQGAHKVNIPTVVLNKAKSASIKGTVKDEAGNALEGVNIRLVEDDLVPVISTDAGGNYVNSSIYEGKYTFRFYKEGYYSVEKEITLSAGNNVLDEVKLRPLGNLSSEKLDYGYNVKPGTDGDYQTVHFASGMKGIAVRFQSPYKGGILKSADLFLVKNKYYSGYHIMIGVLAYDDNKRLREIAPFREYKNITPNAWNTIDFSEFTIKTDKPVYIATMYTKNLENSLGVYYDVYASKNAKEHSYIYDGAFIKTSALTPSGAFAVKSDWLYEAGAQKNPETDDESGAAKPEDPKIIADTEESFVFDAATQTITAYKGNNTAVVVPSSIGGIEVKRIGEKAFIGTSKGDKKLRKIVVSEGIEEIGAEAFKNNDLSEITLPESLSLIGEAAFMNQYKDNFDDKSLKVNLPSNITRIEKDTFASAGSPLVATLPSVSYIASGAFSGIKEIEVNAPKLEIIEDGAFGSYDRADFSYAKVFTSLDSTLTSKDRQYVINPASVSVNMINARDHEDVILKKVYYGENSLQNIGRNTEASKIYRIGDTVSVKAPRLTRKGISYISDTPSLNIKLEKSNDISFYYYLQEVRTRLPILDTDTQLIGFALPNAQINAKVGSKSYEVKSNEDGFFRIEGLELSASDMVEFTVNNYVAGSFSVSQNNNDEYIIEGSVLKRYNGTGGEVVLPVSGTGVAVNEIADFAFYDKSLIGVTLPDAVETIGSGAFMDTGLTSFGWNLNNINQSKLRTINEYAFKNNSLTKVLLPELTHVIRTSAFENNEIEELKFGKYTGHVGDKAFKDNKLKEVELADVAEEIGVGAFMNNRIEKLVVKPRLEGYKHGLDLIPDYAFANNKLSKVKLPIEITHVSELAFEGNTKERFIIESNAVEIVATKAYDVLRSDGTLLKWSEEKQDKPKDHTENNSSSGSGENNSKNINNTAKNNNNNNTANNANTYASGDINNNTNTGKNTTNNKAEDDIKSDGKGGSYSGSSSGGLSSGSGLNSGSLSSGGGSSSGRSSSSGGGLSSGTRSTARTSGISKALPQGYKGQTKIIGNYTVPVTVDKGTWQRDEISKRWKYTDSLGSLRQSAWVEVFNEGLVQKQASKLPFAWYSFDEKGNMRTGWYADDGKHFYYFSEATDISEGAMLTGWQFINGKWYYLNETYGADMGIMLSDTVTADGYRLLPDGSWDGVGK